MDQAAALERVDAQSAGLPPRPRGHCAGHAIVEVEGVEALVSPGAPERSVVNGAVLTGPHDDPTALADGLARLYRGAGVHAWTVWVPPTAHRRRFPGCRRPGTCSTASRSACGAR